MGLGAAELSLAGASSYRVMASTQTGASRSEPSGPTLRVLAQRHVRAEAADLQVRLIEPSLCEGTALLDQGHDLGHDSMVCKAM